MSACLRRGCLCRRWCGQSREDVPLHSAEPQFGCASAVPRSAAPASEGSEGSWPLGRGAPRWLQREAEGGGGLLEIVRGADIREIFHSSKTIKPPLSWQWAGSQGGAVAGAVGAGAAAGDAELGHADRAAAYLRGGRGVSILGVSWVGSRSLGAGSRRAPEVLSSSIFWFLGCAVAALCQCTFTFCFAVWAVVS